MDATAVHLHDHEIARLDGRNGLDHLPCGKLDHNAPSIDTNGE